MPYVCAGCGRPFPEFRLSCPECGAWNAFDRQERGRQGAGGRPVALPEIGTLGIPRRKTAFPELDRLLGGGFVPGSTLLVVGPPGAGKSTLVMQVLRAMDLRALYVSGEESVEQLKLRAERLRINSPRIFLLFETGVNRIAHLVGAADRLGAVVIDSIQTVYTDGSEALPGSPTQIRKCAYILRRLAQARNVILMIVGQVTKDNRAAGPRLLEHAVDVVLSLDVGADPPHTRSLRAVKNRFGSTLPRCELAMNRTGMAFIRGDP